MRYAGTLVVYDRGETTQTNGYGYEVAVGADGVICAAGGNDSAIPAGGYVVSAIEEADRRFLAAYGVPGAKCVLDRAQKKLRIVYGAEEMRRTRCCRMKARSHRLRRQRPPAGFSMPTRRPICSRRCGR